MASLVRRPRAPQWARQVRHHVFSAQRVQGAVLGAWPKFVVTLSENKSMNDEVCRHHPFFVNLTFLDVSCTRIADERIESIRSYEQSRLLMSLAL